MPTINVVNIEWLEFYVVAVETWAGIPATTKNSKSPRYIHVGVVSINRWKSNVSRTSISMRT